MGVKEWTTIVETLHETSPLRANETLRADETMISPKSGSLARILGSYKSAVSKLAHLTNPSFKWKERYHDHIIRDEVEFYRIEEYIVNNPENWANDCLNNDNQRMNHYF